MSFLKASKDKAKMAALIENENAYRHLNTETALLLKQCAKIEIPINQDSEVTDMCQAWQDMANDCRAEGWAEGWAQGWVEGWAQGWAEGWAQGCAEGRAQGCAEGEVKGKTAAYYEMVRNGFLTSGVVASALNQSEAVFNAGLQKYIAGLN